MIKKHLIYIIFAVILLTSCVKEPTIELFSSKDGGFSILLPGKPEFETQTVDTEVGKILMNMYGVENKRMAYLISYSDYNIEDIELIGVKEIEEILDGVRDGQVGDNGKLISEKSIQLDNYSGREIVFSNEEGTIRSRIFLVKNRLYQVLVVSNDNKVNTEEVNKILNSFKLL